MKEFDDEYKFGVSEGDELVDAFATREEAERFISAHNSEKGNKGACFIAEDKVSPAEGQVSKSEFLAQLEAQVREQLRSQFAGTRFSENDCPWLKHLFRHYHRRSAAYLERSLHKYLPGSGTAQSAADYIPLVQQKVSGAVSTWLQTGKITEVPDEVPRSLIRTAEKDTSSMQAGMGKGSELDAGTRSKMESAFGTDLSGVKVHTDNEAGSFAQELDAQAVTIGKDIAMPKDKYKPGTLEGDALLAHELAHVIQQKEAKNEGADPLSASNYTDMEKDAEGATMGVMSKLWGGVKGMFSDLSVKALPRLRSGLQVQRCQSEKFSDTDMSSKTFDELIDEWKAQDKQLLATSSPGETGIQDAVKYMIELHNASNQKVILMRNEKGRKYKDDRFDKDGILIREGTGLRAAYTEMGDIWMEMHGLTFTIKTTGSGFNEGDEVEILYWSRWTEKGDNVIVKSVKDGTIGKLNKNSLTIDKNKKKVGGVNYYNVLSAGGVKSSYSQSLMREAMYNRFDTQIKHWVEFYNAQIIKPPMTKADPNVLKSMLFQESRFGTAGEHLLLPPYNEKISVEDKQLSYIGKTRYNLGQAIDTLSHQQFIMMIEMAPGILQKYGLDKYYTPYLQAKHKQKEIKASKNTTAALSKQEQERLDDPVLQKENEGYDYFYDIPAGQLWNLPGFLKALEEFTVTKNASGKNLNANDSNVDSNMNLLMDYDYMIRTTTRFWFQMYLDTTYDNEKGDWTIATQRYNGSGSNSRIYKKQVYSRVDFTAMHPELSKGEVDIVESIKGQTNSPDPITQTIPKSISEMEARLENEEKPIKDIIINEINKFKKDKKAPLDRKKVLSDQRTQLESDKLGAKTNKEKQDIDEKIKNIDIQIKALEKQIAELDSKIDASYARANKTVSDNNLEQIPWQTQKK